MEGRDDAVAAVDCAPELLIVMLPFMPVALDALEGIAVEDRFEYAEELGRNGWLERKASEA